MQRPYIFMITKPEKIIKRIIKAIGERQSVLLIGNWQEELINLIKENENAVTTSRDGVTPSLPQYEDNSFTKIIADYNSFVFNNDLFFKEVRRLLLPSGMIIVSANCEDGIFDKLIRLFRKDYIKEHGIKRIKPKVLQDQIHDNGFLIDGYYGYPGRHLLMMAQIQNKEVTTLFASEKQETIVK